MQFLSIAELLLNDDIKGEFMNEAIEIWGIPTATAQELFQFLAKSQRPFVEVSTMVAKLTSEGQNYNITMVEEATEVPEEEVALELGDADGQATEAAA